MSHLVSFALLGNDNGGFLQRQKRSKPREDEFSRSTARPLHTASAGIELWAPIENHQGQSDEVDGPIGGREYRWGWLLCGKLRK